MSLIRTALQRALADVRIYRAGMLAALDQLALMQQQLDRQQRQMADLREELAWRRTQVLEAMKGTDAELR